MEKRRPLLIGQIIGNAGLLIAPFAIAGAIVSFISGHVGRGIAALVVAAVAVALVLFVRTPPDRRRLRSSVVGGEVVGYRDDDTPRIEDDPGGPV